MIIGYADPLKLPKPVVYTMRKSFWGPPVGFAITVYGQGGAIAVVVPSKTKRGHRWMQRPISKSERERALKAAHETEQVGEHAAK